MPELDRTTSSLLIGTVDAMGAHAVTLPTSAGSFSAETVKAIATEDPSMNAAATLFRHKNGDVILTLTSLDAIRIRLSDAEYRIAKDQAQKALA